MRSTDMTQVAFPKLLSSQIAFDIARTILDGFDKHYRLFRQTSQDAKRHFEKRRLGRGAQQAARERIDFLRPARAGMRAGAGRRIRQSRTDRRSLARTQAALHRHAVRPQAAGTGRNLLQFGLLQHPAPQLFPQRFHLRAPGGLHRVHRNRRTAADLPRVLPGARTACASRSSASSPTSSSTAQFADLDARHRAGRSAGCALFGREQARAEPPDPGAVEPVLPQQGRLHRRQGHQRQPRIPVRRADPAQPPRRAGTRHRAVRPRTDHHPVFVHARLLPGRHGSAVGLRAIPAHACCRASRAARSTPSSACKSRARRCSTAITCST